MKVTALTQNYRRNIPTCKYTIKQRKKNTPLIYEFFKNETKQTFLTTTNSENLKKKSVFRLQNKCSNMPINSHPGFHILKIKNEMLCLNKNIQTILVQCP